MTLLSPLGLLVGLAALLPLAALVAGPRRAARVRARLGLAAPRGHGLTRAAAAVAVPLLLALACAQPALTREEQRRARTDAAAFVIVDVSRSMQAAATPGAPTRLDRAREVALRIRRELGSVPTGVASMTDRVVPLLFPSSDDAVFRETVTRSLASESPPPRESDRVATTLAALADAARGGLFLPGDRHRAFVVVTDGESQPFSEGAVARALDAARIELVTVHVWAEGERVYRGAGTAERLYRADERSGDTLAALAAAAGGNAFEEDVSAAAGRAAARALGSGPTRAVAAEERLVPLAPWLALASLAALAVALAPRLPWRGVAALPGLRPHRTIGAE